MTSPLPPRRRDSRNLADLIRQDRQYLKQLGVGFAGGRFSPAKPLRPVYDGDEEDDGDDDTTALAAINTDRVTVTTAGIVTLPLTYVPLDGSLHVRWDGDDLHPSEWTMSGQSVVYADPHLHVGDVLTAAYFYYPSDVPGAPLAATVTSRATTPGIYAWGTFSSSGGSGPPIPLPGGTQVGDLIVVAAISAGAIAISDPRLTFVGNNMWVGWATNLADIPVTLGSPWYAITCDTFATDASGWTAAQVTSNPSLSVGSTIATPVVSGVSAAICAGTATIFSFGSCAIGAPTDYTNVANIGNPLSSSINLWTADSIGASPAGVLTYTGGGDGAIYATTIGLIGPVDS